MLVSNGQRTLRARWSARPGLPDGRRAAAPRWPAQYALATALPVAVIKATWPGSHVSRLHERTCAQSKSPCHQSSAYHAGLEPGFMNPEAGGFTLSYR